MEEEEKKREKLEEREYPFIEEEIVSDRKKQQKSNLYHTIGIAFFFGLIGGFSFWSLTGFFQSASAEPEAKKISFVSPVPTVPYSNKPTDSPNKETEKPSPSVTREPVISDYNRFYAAVENIAGTVNRSIVTVTSVEDKLDWFNNPLESQESCYGVIIADNERDYVILTSYNQIKNGKEVKVIFPQGGKYTAKYYGSDQEMGIAVIGVAKREVSKESKEDIVVASLGESYSLTAGTPLIALGNPNGMMYSVTQGIVSGESHEKYITDYKLDLFYGDLSNYSKGEGFVVNSNEEIVGVITHNFSNDTNNNIFTFMGISRLKPVIENLVNQNTQKGMGIIAYDIPIEYANANDLQCGIFISKVNSNSPAYEAGLRANDIIVSIGNEDVRSVMAYYNIINKYKEKDVVTVKAVRAGQGEKKEKTYSVVLEKKK